MHGKVETTNTKNISNLHSVDKNVSTNLVKNGSKESELKCIEELISQNDELKNSILEVLFFAIS